MSTTGNKERAALIEHIHKLGCPEMTDDLLQSMIVEASEPRDVIHELNQMVRLDAELDVEELLQFVFEAWNATSRPELAERAPVEIGGNPTAGRVEQLIVDSMKRFVQQNLDQINPDGMSKEELEQFIYEREQDFIHTPMEALGWHTPREMIDDERDGLIEVDESSGEVVVEHLAPRPMADVRARQPFEPDDGLLQTVDALMVRHMEAKYSPDEVHIARLIWGDFCDLKQPGADEIDLPGIPAAAVEWVVNQLVFEDETETVFIAEKYKLDAGEIQKWYRRISTGLSILRFDERYPLSESPLRMLPPDLAEQYRSSIEIPLVAPLEDS